MPHRHSGVRTQEVQVLLPAPPHSLQDALIAHRPRGQDVRQLQEHSKSWGLCRRGGHMRAGGVGGAGTSLRCSSDSEWRCERWNSSIMALTEAPSLPSRSQNTRSMLYGSWGATANISQQNHWLNPQLIINTTEEGGAFTEPGFRTCLHEPEPWPEPAKRRSTDMITNVHTCTHTHTHPFTHTDAHTYTPSHR